MDSITTDITHAACHGGDDDRKIPFGWRCWNTAGLEGLDNFYVLYTLLREWAYQTTLCFSRGYQGVAGAMAGDEEGAIRKLRPRDTAAFKT